MLRLFLGLYLVMAVGLVAALQAVEHTFNALLDGQMQAYNREAVRGQAWSLVEQVREFEAAQREQQLQKLRPHYGLGLSLVDATELDLNEREKQQLAEGTLVIRQDYTQFITSIDGGPQL